MAYVLLCALRRIGLHHTPFAKATCGTIRLKLLKIGALMRVSVRLVNLIISLALILPGLRLSPFPINAAIGANGADAGTGCRIYRMYIRNRSVACCIKVM